MLRIWTKHLKTYFLATKKTRITNTGQKLNSRFQIKDEINEKHKHKHDLIYYTKCRVASCAEEYLGETGRRIKEGVADHDGKDKHSHLLKHALLWNHRRVALGNMKIIDSSFHDNKFKRKVSEAPYIKQYRPSLNSQEQPVELKLFNYFFYFY